MTNALAAPGPAGRSGAHPAGPAVDRPAQNPVWPVPDRPAPPRLLISAGVAGVGVAGLLPSRIGLNVLLAGLLIVSALAPAVRRNRTSVIFCVLALALLAVPLVRDAGWLAALAIGLAVPLGSYALTGGRSWTELIAGGAAFSFAALLMLPWAGHGIREMAASRRGPVGPLVRSLLLTGALLLVFGALFAQADAAFRAVIADLIPRMSPGVLLLHAVVFGVTAGVVLTGAYLAASRPRLRELVPPAARSAGRTTWAIPIAALDLLFLGFTAVQADVLLAANRDDLLAVAGLSYAEYARQGFWQLLVVTGLVLAVIAVAVRHAPLAGPRDRALVRGLLGLLCALTLVVVAVALRRLYLYEEAYGYTRLRVWVHAFELWLGLVVVLIGIAGIRLRAAWLPRAVAVSGAVGLLALGLGNPDGFIADRTVRDYPAGGRADLSYLTGLSADVVPALDRLPEPQRSCALRSLVAKLPPAESWPSTNLSRRGARALLAERPIDPSARCP